MAAEARGSDFVEQLAAGGRDGTEELIGGQPFVWRDGILRQRALLSESQAQTADTFGFKWERTQSYESSGFLEMQQGWLREKYGNPAAAPWWDGYGPAPVLLDAGCGVGLSAVEVFGERLEHVRYVGVDVSSAVDVAARRFADRGLPTVFLQADLLDLPLPGESVDVVFSEGVLHHTDDPPGSLATLSTAARARWSHPVLRVPAQGADPRVHRRLRP